MFKKIRYFIYSLIGVGFVISCAIHQATIDNNLMPYYNSFMNLVELNCPKLKERQSNIFIMKFGKLEFPTIGLCSKSPRYSIVTVHPAYWETATEDDRYQLVMHELTHCILDLDHVNDKGNYMNPDLSYLTKRETTNQVIENIRARCNK